MSSALVRRERCDHLVASCLGCREVIVNVPAVGWFDPDRRHSYDICPADRFGNHTADRPSIVG